MRVLALDTATRATVVAVVDTDGAGGVVNALEARDDPAPGERPRHTKRLLPLIVEVLERSESTWNEVQRLAVGVGPGTFTGLRVGIATGRALAQARVIELVGISTLESLALGAASAGPGALEHDVVLAVLDARRGEVFAGAWAVAELASGNRRALLQPRAVAPEELARGTLQLDGSLLMVGDGAVEFRRVLERSGLWIPEDDSPRHRVSAVNHGRLADSRSPALRGDVGPEYLRVPDAELALRATASP